MNYTDKIFLAKFAPWQTIHFTYLSSLKKKKTLVQIYLERKCIIIRFVRKTIVNINDDKTNVTIFLELVKDKSFKYLKQFFHERALNREIEIDR